LPTTFGIVLSAKGWNPEARTGPMGDTDVLEKSFSTSGRYEFEFFVCGARNRTELSLVVTA
jgi:hypothetical protein